MTVKIEQTTRATTRMMDAEWDKLMTKAIRRLNRNGSSCFSGSIWNSNQCSFFLFGDRTKFANVRRAPPGGTLGVAAVGGGNRAAPLPLVGRVIPKCWNSVRHLRGLEHRRKQTGAYLTRLQGHFNRGRWATLREVHEEKKLFWALGWPRTRGKPFRFIEIAIILLYILQWHDVRLHRGS